MKKIISILAFALFTGVMSFAASRTAVNGFMMQNDGVLWVQNVEGEVVYSTETEKGVNLAAGTAIKIYKDEIVYATLVTNNGKTKTPDVKFVRVSYEGKDYLALANRIAEGSSLSVILNKAVTYNTANPSDYTKKILEPFSYVIAKKNVQITSAINFKQVAYYDERDYAVKVVYVSSSKISNIANDVKAVELIAKIDSSSDSAVKEALIDTAFKLNVSAEIAARLRILDSEIHGSDLSEDVEDVSLYVKIFTGDGSKLNYRDLPGTKGSVVGQIADGEEVYVSQKTVFEETLDDATSSWLRVSVDGKDVWIFGAYTYEISAPPLDESYDNEIESNQSLDEDDANYGE